ncbi:hypothetical protein [Chitinophaga sp. RAB17]|uniref:hypothetical protein n=1 Tax=Chitinophaga sp. RAB17 TaxID=3233049 RepID=UPI003F8EA4A5
MKKNYPLARCAMILLFVVLFSNCVKSPICLPAPPHYEITGFGAEKYDNTKDTFHITYNSRHNPIHIIGRVITENYPQYLLGYDAQNALKIVIGASHDESTEFEMGYKCVCDNKKRVISDSVFAYGHYDRNTLTIVDARYLFFVRKYAYDHLDRITQVVDKRFLLVEDLFEMRTTSYFYNASGNAYKINTLILYPNGSTVSNDVFPVYDNKVNPNLLHPLWQFFNLDYSRNNPFIADSYNSYGLPVKVPFKNPKMDSQHFLLYPVRAYEIFYGRQ